MEAEVRTTSRAATAAPPERSFLIGFSTLGERSAGPLPGSLWLTTSPAPSSFSLQRLEIELAPGADLAMLAAEGEDHLAGRPRQLEDGLHARRRSRRRQPIRLEMHRQRPPMRIVAALVQDSDGERAHQTPDSLLHLRREGVSLDFHRHRRV